MRGLLRDLELHVAQVAVEINREILEQRDFDTRPLRAGDRVEIMSFIGGGARRGSERGLAGNPLRAVAPRHRRRDAARRDGVPA